MDLSKMSVEEVVKHARATHDWNLCGVVDELARRLVENELTHTTRLRAAEAEVATLYLHKEGDRQEKAILSHTLVAWKARAEAAEKMIDAQDKLLVSYRTSRPVAGKVLDTIAAYREASRTRTPTPTPATGQEETR